MGIFRKYVQEIWPLVPTILRKKADNVVNLMWLVSNQGMDAVAEALTEFITVSYPLTTASGWMLDEHWGPYVNVQRNGLTDEEFRLYIRAKRLLNRSWGAVDQALNLFQLFLPTANLEWVPSYPKAWTIYITGVDMGQAALALAFMEKKPSPEGGGFSVCGDNGFAHIYDEKCFNYKSEYGTIGVDYVVTGWFTSEYGDPGSATAGYAHVVQI